ncbi:MAG: LysO family transporter [Desulfovibrionaceae bacterium]|nr:LysO family transporter [Desulfovibrionaceae bacterium]
MFLGMFAGYLLRHSPVSAWICRLVMPCILALLFCMGFLIGGNDTIMDNLHTLGLQGAALACATLVGSVIAVLVIVRLFPDTLKNSSILPGQPSADLETAAGAESRTAERRDRQ